MFKHKEKCWTFAYTYWFYPLTLATKNTSCITSLCILPLSKEKYLYLILDLLSLNLCKWYTVPSPAVPIAAPPYMVRNLLLCLFQIDFSLLEYCFSWICHSSWGLPSVLCTSTAFFDSAGSLCPKYPVILFVFLTVVLD